MKSAAIWVLLTVLAGSCAVTTKAQQMSVAQYQRKSVKDAKKQQKAFKRNAKLQQKAQKRAAKAQAKSLRAGRKADAKANRQIR
jgi:hypothetical protein